MITAVDTSVLIAIAKGEPSAVRWVEVLEECRAAGDLVISEVVAAELFALLADQAKFEALLAGLGLVFVPTTMPAAQRAGLTFRQYRRAGGSREHLVPDFLIAAHAQCQADRIAAIDRGYLRRYFRGLKIVRPA